MLLQPLILTLLFLVTLSHATPAFDLAKIPHCTKCPNCNVPAAGGVQLVPKFNDILYYTNTPEDPVNYQFLVTMIHGDSSQVGYVIERKLPKGRKPELQTPTTVFRLKFYNQFGYGSDEYVEVQGYTKCQTYVYGPPNIEGRIMANMLAYRK